MVHIPVLSLPASYGDVFVSVGNDDYMGWEFSASGSMTDDLSIIASGMPTGQEGVWRRHLRAWHCVGTLNGACAGSARCAEEFQLA
jgi:hypothetical protein